jgi:hypothetical protein
MKEEQVYFTCQHCGQMQSIKDEPLIARDHPVDKDESDFPDFEIVSAPQEEQKITPADPALTTRCPKCFHLQRPSVFCVRCGLDISKAELYKMNWLPSTAHREEEWRKALSLWNQIEEDPSRQMPHNIFLKFCTENKLLDLASRQYRKRLVENPNETQTAYYFKETATRLETMAMAGLKTDNRLQSFADRVRVFRRILVIIAVLLCFIGFAVFIWISTSSGRPSGLEF